jgi:hypothetical protein
MDKSPLLVNLLLRPFSINPDEGGVNHADRIDVEWRNLGFLSYLMNSLYVGSNG